MSVRRILLGLAMLWAAKSFAGEQHGLTTVFMDRGYDGQQTAIVTFQEKQFAERITPALDCVWGMGNSYQNRKIEDIWPDLNKNSFLVIRWVGKVKATKAGTYTFRFGADQRARLVLDGQLLSDTVHEGRGCKYRDFSLNMKEGQSKEIVVEFCNWSNGF
ncbi:MAG: PA14 domain-containing protein, partial [Rectinemataceae bacterium]|nr:PA14 domain-containing protein [Rectinemataceae bacterium]